MSRLLVWQPGKHIRACVHAMSVSISICNTLYNACTYVLHIYSGYMCATQFTFGIVLYFRRHWFYIFSVPKPFDWLGLMDEKKIPESCDEHIWVRFQFTFCKCVHKNGKTFIYLICFALYGPLEMQFCCSHSQKMCIPCKPKFKTIFKD